MHKHVVGFKSFFEDRHNVYILLELCANKVRYVLTFVLCCEALYALTR